MNAPAPFRERLSFDPERGALMDQTRRYMLIRPEALMGIFRRLPEAERRQALEGFRGIDCRTGLRQRERLCGHGRRRRGARAHGRCNGAAARLGDLGD